MNAPFQWAKVVASHLGGTRNNMVVSWPARIKDAGGIRSQFHHIVDIAPTILELTKITAPDELNGVQQKPIEGVSMAYTLDNPTAPTTHKTQYFELMSNRGIYSDGWMASTTPMRLPWVVSGPDPKPGDFKWELYNLDADPSQSTDLAAQNPAKLKEMQAIFDSEARKYNVVPLDSSYAARADASLRPSLAAGRTSFNYYPGAVRISEGTAPDTKNKSFSVTAAVDVPAGGANGVLATQGGDFGGWSLYVNNGKPEFAYAYSNQAQHKSRVASATALAPGKHVVRFDLRYDGGGRGKGALGVLLVDGKEVAQGRIPNTIPVRYSLDETFDVGEDTGTAVVTDYAARMPFKFNGELEKLTIDLK
jgi:arylsulfatase